MPRLGAADLTSAAQRLRVSVIFVAFEAGMPLIGLAASGGLARVIGGVADYVAAAAVARLGAGQDPRRNRGRRAVAWRGPAATPGPSRSSRVPTRRTPDTNSRTRWSLR
jgi:hypothetical protein